MTTEVGPQDGDEAISWDDPRTTFNVSRRADFLRIHFGTGGHSAEKSADGPSGPFSWIMPRPGYTLTVSTAFSAARWPSSGFHGSSYRHIGVISVFPQIVFLGLYIAAG